MKIHSFNSKKKLAVAQRMSPSECRPAKASLKQILKIEFRLY